MIPIILAAGKCSRFYPYGDAANHKSMVFLGGKPILQYTIESLKDSGFNEVAIVVNKSDKKIRDYFGSGENFRIKINYIIQKEPKGMGDALLCAKDFIKDDFLVLNANQINISDFFNELANFKKEKNVAGVIVGKKESAGEKFGAFELQDDRILKIIEKPSLIKKDQGTENIRVVGVYWLNKNFIPFLEKTPSGENSFENALNDYFLKNEVKVFITEKKTFSLKYPWDLFEIKNFILKKLPGFISEKASIKKDVVIEGKVFIEEGAVVYEKAIIKGPCYIGKNSVVGNFVLIRNGCVIEENCVIGARAEVKNSLFLKNSSMHSGFVGDSIIGENSRLGAGFISANKRFDNQNVKVIIKGEKIDTKLNRLGVFIGADVNIGVQSATMPGVIIGNKATVFPGQKIFQNIPEEALIK